MSFPGGLLNVRNEPIMGSTFILNPGFAVGGEPQEVAQILPPSFTLSSLSKHDTQHTVITCSCHPLSFTPPLAPVATLLQNTVQIVLSFTTGNSQFGSIQDPPVFNPIISGNIVTQLTPQIRIDAQNAVISLTAASMFNVKFRYFSKTIGPNFLLGESFGPPIRVNIGYSYGTPKTIHSWLTDVPQLLATGPVANSQAAWAKPQFAEAFQILFRNDALVTLDNFMGYIDIIFFDLLANIVDMCQIIAPIDQFPIINWPSNAHYVRINLFNFIFIPGGNMNVIITPRHIIRL